MLLLLVIGVKHALGQDESPIGWDLENDPTQDVAAVMIAAPILGAVQGALRLLTANAFRPFITLGLRSDAWRPGRLR
jgi:hypothetical protein